MRKSVKVVVLGVSGKMGRMILQALSENSSAKLIGAVERKGHEWIGKDLGTLTSGKENGIEITDQPLRLFANADAVIDFTTPGSTVQHSAISAQARLVHVIGTTGFSKDQLKKIKIASQHATIIRAGNMSLGVNLLTQLTQKIARILDDQYDIEILEMHHNQKVDAPSGTALMLGEAAAEGRKISLEKQFDKSIIEKKSGRVKGSIGFASLRGGDVVGEHEVIFSALGERIVLKHVATDRMIFARGAVQAAIWGRDKDPGEYDMVDVLGL